MKKIIFLFFLFFSTQAFSQGTETPKTKVIPSDQLGPAASLLLNLTVPEDYVWVKRFVDLAGIVVLCAASDETLVAATGDFSRASNAVISLRQSGNDYYDTSRKSFSFEGSIESEIKTLGAKNLIIEKRDVRGIPVAVVTFEVGDKKLYSIAIAKGSMVYRVSYNARSKPRAYDDAAWSALVNGL